eukprot:764643-Hanusia_phi.AAC.1
MIGLSLSPSPRQAHSEVICRSAAAAGPANEQPTGPPGAPVTAGARAGVRGKARPGVQPYSDRTAGPRRPLCQWPLTQSGAPPPRRAPGSRPTGPVP